MENKTFESGYLERFKFEYLNILKTEKRRGIKIE